MGYNSSNAKQESWVGGELTCLEQSVFEPSVKFPRGFNSIWSKSAFSILTLTKKFITNMKELSMKYKFSQMRNTYFDLIDDKATNYSYYRVRGYFKNNPPKVLQKELQSCAAAFNRNCVYIEKND